MSLFCGEKKKKKKLVEEEIIRVGEKRVEEKCPLVSA